MNDTPFNPDDRVSRALSWLDQAVPAGLSGDTAANIRRWLTQPGYEEFRPQLLMLVEDRNTEELTRLFWEQIPFGTGGRRGPMAELGSATINARTIAESAWGLATYILKWRESSSPSATAPRVVIAYDGRERSSEFADVCGRVMAAAGFQVYGYAEPRATPQLSFSVRHLAADCGIMISASHNPPSDNGFKAYWSTGGQVVPPHDMGIIQWVRQAAEISLADKDEMLATGQWIINDRGIDQAYQSAVSSLSRNSAREVRVLFTPLHGVGGGSIMPVLQQAGFEQVEVFNLQSAVDGRFSNVPDHLPNPERTAVLRPAIQYAEEHGHDLVLASDPDADRLAVAMRTRDNRYACLTGNQLGALLADFAVNHRTNRSSTDYMLTTLVTTPLIGAIARAAGIQVVDDLPVGFKHIGNEMEHRGGPHLIFAAEESLGYLAGDYCRDKDAALAALWTCELAAELKADGKTLLDQLQSLYREFGWHRESQVSHELAGPEGAGRIAALIRQFRETPPDQIGNIPLRRIRDFGRQVIRTMPGNRVTDHLSVQAGDLLFADFWHEDVTAQVALRPSGTEPKLKCYFFAQSPPSMSFREGDERSMDLLKILQSGLEQWIREAQP